jgi:phosphoribosylformylglycinamidine cyclo-ligase
MTTYAQAGVNINIGDQTSQIAYEGAKATFSARQGMIGEPVQEDGGFAGLLDMGDYYLVQGDDGIGTKSQIAEAVNKFDTLGYDLLAMVCDDAICTGAETISITNTLDINKVDPVMMTELMKGLTAACQQQKIVIPGGEIAELGNLVNGGVWNATAVGVVKKDRVINGASVEVGDSVISLYEPGFRSNGFSLVRYILEQNLGKQAYQEKAVFDGVEQSWGEAVLTPSTIYQGAILNLIGRFHETPKVNVKGIVHITGGGIPGNVNRILKRTGLGVNLSDLWEPSSVVQAVQKLGNVSNEESYKTWNMGNGMMLIVNPKDADTVIKSLAADQIKAKVAGTVTADSGIRF